MIDYASYTVPTGKPQNVTSYAINSTSIYVQWNEVNCLERNGDITTYNVSYQAIGYSQPSVSLRTSATARSVTVINLIPHTNYSLQVAAENVNGTGPSKEVTVTTSTTKGKCGS